MSLMAGLCLQSTSAWPQRPGAAAAESRPDAAKYVNHTSRDQEEEKDYSCEHWEYHYVLLKHA